MRFMSVGNVKICGLKELTCGRESQDVSLHVTSLTFCEGVQSKVNLLFLYEKQKKVKIVLCTCYKLIFDLVKSYIIDTNDRISITRDMMIIVRD